ncbi:MAG: hypothetical protein JWM04_373 [Verrucomicrobiales bacterium]|jgi:TolA-binding protein|nr:hypothetical protein [Verrucomicrobiales bacterium]
MNDYLPLEVSLADSYFTMMKRTLVLLVASLLGGLCMANAQELDKAEAAEKLTRLAGDIEAVQASNATIQKRFSSLNEELRSAKDEIAKLRAANNNSTTQEELKKLAEKIIEVDKKREADKKLILDEMKNLKETILASIKDLNTSTSRQNIPTTTKPPQSTRNEPNTSGGTASTATEKFYEYVVEKGDSLPTIVVAYNETFKSQNRKTITRKMVRDANPTINWDKLQPKQKILIPVPE